MTAAASVIAPLVPPVVGVGGPPSSAGSDRPLRGLSLPRLSPQSVSSMVVGVGAIDASGRVADHGVLRVLGWGPGTRLDIHEHAGLIVVRAHPHGAFVIPGQGRLRLPATVRHWCHLAAGDRLLLSGEPGGMLLVYPPGVVAAMVADWQARVLGGDPR